MVVSQLRAPESSTTSTRPSSSRLTSSTYLHSTVQDVCVQVLVSKHCWCEPARLDGHRDGSALGRERSGSSSPRSTACPLDGPAQRA